MADVDQTRWTNRSVRRLLASEGASDPAEAVSAKAQDVALRAMEQGWKGPPFDPFELAALLDVTVVARQDVDEARLLVDGESKRIEFNPSRRMARIRFSVAHELAHLLFDDAAEQVRERHLPDPTTSDLWQLEMLCNVGASEFLMPAGAFPEARVDDLSLAQMLDLRAQFGVSTEAVLRRAIRLTEQPAAMFVATRQDRDVATIDYVTKSRAWDPPFGSGFSVPSGSLLSRVTAVGFTQDGHEQWAEHDVRVQAVGVPAYGGHRFPRIIGLVSPLSAEDRRAPASITFVRGDATQPDATEGDALIHVVNNAARTWGGRGFASELRRKHPEVHDSYTAWASSSRALGSVHWARTAGGVDVASMVAQAGYGSDDRVRLRLGALHECLRAVGAQVRPRGGRVHMPLIGTGYGGVRWPVVQDLVLEDLCTAGVSATVYVRPDAVMPGEADAQLSLLG
jgi:Zn-dependent peptidase ImmA (M78 family)